MLNVQSSMWLGDGGVNLIDIEQQLCLQLSCLWIKLKPETRVSRNFKGSSHDQHKEHQFSQYTVG